MLLTDKNAWQATRQDLIEVPLPSGTSSYTPVPHLDFLEQVRSQVPSIGLTVQFEQLALARDGAQLFGCLACTNGTDGHGVNMAIGLRNSYDRSLSCGLVAGAQVIVCSNLWFIGEVSMNRRHTRYVLEDLPDRIEDMLGEVLVLKDRQLEEIDGLKAHDLTDLQAHDLMVRTVRDGVFPASKIPRVIGEWDDPQHEEFAPRTAWSLLNAFTEVNKTRGVAAQLDTGLHRVFQQAILN